MSAGDRMNFLLMKGGESEKTSIGPLDWSEFLGTEDYLGKAAVKAGDYDKAWGLLHEEKSYFAKHAQKCGWSAADLVRADGGVSEAFANVMRLEAKHDQALVHILYWIMSSTTPIKRHDDKLRAYFGRCKFKGATLAMAQTYIDELDGLPDFPAIQSQVSEWRQLD